ncbi:MAG: hypothetical protein WCY76_09100 [Leucobacter sp.]
MRRRYRALLVAPLVAPLVALSLASCAGGAAGGSADAPDLERSLVDIADQPGSVDGFAGALEDVVVETCEAQGAGWFASGTVTNPTDTAQSYRLYVAFSENRDTIGLVQVDVPEVAAGESATWDAEAQVAGEGIDCALRVERFAPAG